MLVKILTCKLNKLISHIFKSVFSSAKANSHVHNGIINIFKPWSLIKEWALAKTKFGKHLPFALHSLFYFPVYSTNSYSFATLLLKSLLRSSRIWTHVFLFFPTYSKMLTTSGSPMFPIYSPCFHNSSPSSRLQTPYPTSFSHAFFKADLHSAPLPSLSSLLANHDLSSFKISEFCAVFFFLLIFFIVLYLLI